MGRLDGGTEAVLLQTQKSQSIVAAIVFGKRGRQGCIVHLRHLADVGVEIPYRLEMAGRQAAPMLPQCGQRGFQAVAKATAGGEVGKLERGHERMGRADIVSDSN